MVGDIAFLITTYNRPNSLRKLVSSIKGLGDIFIIDDGTPDAKPVKGTRYYWQENMGKKGYAQTVTTLWNMPTKRYDYYIMLPDDFLPVELFHYKAIMTWVSIYDYDKMCLNLFADKSRYMKPCWTGWVPEDKGKFLLTQWVDMCFLAEWDFFDFFDWRCPAIFRDFDKNPELGSGVGAAISRRLFDAGKNLYQVKQSLFTVQPAGMTSVMNQTTGTDIYIPVL